MERIVSLIPSGTEIVCALGGEAQLVGRSHECDYPSSVAHLPICTEPNFQVEGSSQEIDQRVKALLQNTLSVYRVNTETLQRLRPDLIVTQTQCDVCAVSLHDVEQAIRECFDSQTAIVSLQTTDLSGVWDDIARVANELGRLSQGKDLIESLQTRMSLIANKTRDLPDHPAVACIEWMDPLMSSGNWMPELVAMAGGRNIFGDSGQHAPWITWESLLEKDPDVILVLPCGFSIQQSQDNLSSLTGQDGWSHLKAVRTGQVYLADGNHYFNRPGPRLVESLEILAEIFHPSAFRFSHQGVGWEKLSHSLNG